MTSSHSLDEKRVLLLINQNGGPGLTPVTSKQIRQMVPAAEPVISDSENPAKGNTLEHP